ncbi:hypothetical protein [Microbacterium pumilum]|uniref:hypothetical protein n=1 Tax=Microbacterium pumilum TaxID=344165 RepID=UPI0031D32A56
MTTVASVASVTSLASPAAAADAPVLVGDGKTDDAPALQRFFDLNLQPPFQTGKTYLLNSPVFLDDADRTSMYVVDLNGATLLLGKSLPTTDAFYRDPTTKWAIFPNTKRSALAGGKVNVSVATRGTGVYTGALISMVLRNGTVDGAGANVGLSFANRTGSKFESIILKAGRTLLSWFDYSDASVFIQCHNRAGGPAASTLIEQINSGDGLLMQSCKADATVGLARLKYCRGAEIVSTVTGRIELDQCSAIMIRGGHQETPLANDTIVDVRSSDVVLDTTALYLARGPVGSALPPAIRITDTGTAPSSVVLRDCTEMRALLDTDDELGALVSIDKTIAGTKFEARSLTSAVSVRKVGGVWNPSIGPDITGVGTIAAAVAASSAVIAGGSFILRNPGSGWAARTTIESQNTVATAPVVALAVSTDAFVGSLAGSGTRYRCRGVLPDGTETPWTTYTPVAAAVTGTIKLVISTVGGPQELQIRRYSATSTTAEAHLSVPAGAVAHTLYDTGGALNGFAWLPGT